ncbi:MAG: BON domain-containing protein [Steroidobacteraceae bacterium]
MSSYLRKFYGLASVFTLTGVLAGCATYEKCGLEGCAGDSKVTANVQSLLEQHPDLEENSIDVQTLDHVVYLTGMVATGLESEEANSVALEAPGVKRVVNLIAVAQ